MRISALLGSWGVVTLLVLMYLSPSGAGNAVETGGFALQSIVDAVFDAI